MSWSIWLAGCRLIRRVRVRERVRARAAQAAWAALTLVFLFLALDGRLHWDEPAYLYAGAYFSAGEIVGGAFQPSGIEDQNLSRVLHLLLVHAVVQVTGPGLLALLTVQLLYLALLVGFLGVSWLVLRELLGASARLELAIGGLALTPIVPYFAFKTLPEIPALFFTALASLTLLYSFHGRRAWWLGVSALALVATALCKNSMVLLHASLVVSLLVCRPDPYGRPRLLVHALVSGVASLVVFAGALAVMGIDLERYLAIGRYLLDRDEPLAVAALNILLEGGIFFLAVPLAFIAQRRQALFFTTWLLLATVPLPLLIDYVESRYLATNLIALSGLIYLAGENLRPYVLDWWRRSGAAGPAVAVSGLLTIILSDVIALAIMAHEVRIDQLHALVRRLDNTYQRYAVLTPWPYTDFHYLRFAYPHLDVYSVQSVHPKDRSLERRRAFERRFYPGRVLLSIEDLAAVEGTPVYIGFEENHGVANLRTIVGMVPMLDLQRHLAQKDFLNHLALSWMWDDPRVRLAELMRVGHHFAYEVELPRPAD